MAIAQSDYLEYHNAYYDPTQLTSVFSPPQTLNQGDLYYYEVYGVNGGNWNSHFMMGVIAPNPDPAPHVNSVPVIYKLDIAYPAIFEQISIKIENSVANN